MSQGMGTNYFNKVGLILPAFSTESCSRPDLKT